LSAVLIILFSCTGSLIQKSAEFENKEWIVQSFDYNDIENPDGKIFLKFNRSGKRLSGFGGCNFIVGSYSVTGSDLSIKPVRSKDTCIGFMETEDKLMTVLEKTNEFREITSSDKDYLRLITPDGSSIELRLKIK
jgi:heat shock protein HslJ